MTGGGTSPQPSGSLGKGARSVVLQYEVMLQEALAVAGEPGAGTGQAPMSPKRLAILMGLMRQLLGVRAFGALQGLVAMVFAELNAAVYMDGLVSAEKVSEGNPPGWKPSLEKRTPFFEALRVSTERNKVLEAVANELREKYDGGEDIMEQKLKLSLRRAMELQSELSKVQQTLATRDEELEQAQGEKRRLLDQSRQDSRNMVNDIEKYRVHIAKLEQELQKYKGISMQEEIARRAFHVVAHKMREDKELAERPEGPDGVESTEDAAATTGPHGSPPSLSKAMATTKAPGRDLASVEASKLVDQLLLLQNVRVDKYERQLTEAGLKPLAGEAVRFAKNSRAKVLQEEFVQELALAQQEIKGLKDHLKEVRLEVRVAKSAAGLLVRPEELETLATRPRAFKKNQTRITFKSTTGAGGEAAPVLGPGGGDPMWSDFIRQCEDEDEVNPPTPRIIKPELAKQHLLGAMRNKCKRDLDPKLGGLGKVGEDREGAGTTEGSPVPRMTTATTTMDDPTSTSTTSSAATTTSTPHLHTPHKKTPIRSSISDHLYHCLLTIYADRQVSMLIMHGILMSIERHRTDDPVMDLMAKALGGSLEEPVVWALVEFERLVMRNVDKHTDFVAITERLYPEMHQSQREAILDEFDDMYAGFNLADSVLCYFASKLLVKGEARYIRWLDILFLEDTMGRRLMGRADVLRVTAKHLYDVPREVVIQVHTLLAQSWGHADIPIETLALAITALEMGTITMARRV